MTSYLDTWLSSQSFIQKMRPDPKICNSKKLLGGIFLIMHIKLALSHIYILVPKKPYPNESVYAVRHAESRITNQITASS